MKDVLRVIYRSYHVNPFRSRKSHSRGRRSHYRCDGNLMSFTYLREKKGFRRKKKKASKKHFACRMLNRMSADGKLNIGEPYKSDFRRVMIFHMEN